MNQPGEYGQEPEMEGVRHISWHQMGQQRQKERARLQEGMFPGAAALRCGYIQGRLQRIIIFLIRGGQNMGNSPLLQ